MELREDRSKHPAPGVVQVSPDTEDALLIGKVGGKKRAPKGTPHLPGGSFGRPIYDDYWTTAVVGRQAERRSTDSARHRAVKKWNETTAFHNPSVNPKIGSLRSTKSDGAIETLIENPNYTYCFEEHGGTHQNPPEAYDPVRHGWYHQATRTIVGRGRPNKENRVQAELIRKSKDHIGYGNGMIGYGDVQSTSLAGDCPTWMFGMRMIPGVVGSGFPRWQYCMVEDGKLVTKMRYFQRGPNLGTVETIGGKKPSRFDRSILDYRQPLAVSTKPKINYVSDKRQSSLIGAGAVCQDVIMPPSAHHTKDPDHRVFRKVDRY